MPIIIHRPDLEPLGEVYPYDKVLGVIMIVLVGLWIAGDIIMALLVGSVAGFMAGPESGAAKTGDLNAVHRDMVVGLILTLGSGTLFVAAATGIRSSFRYGFWLAFPAGIAMTVTSGLPTSERAFMQWLFALGAMGYSAWRLLGWVGSKPR